MRGSLTGNYVRKTGDTMTGDLTISKNGATVILNDPSSVNATGIKFARGGVVENYIRASVGGTSLIYQDVLAGLDRVSLRRIDGVMTVGIVPLARMQSAQSSAQNAGAVTVTAALTTIVDTASITVVTNDIVLVGGAAELQKGVTAGKSRLSLAQIAGTATIVFLNAQTTLDQSVDQINGTAYQMSVFGIVLVTAGGTLTLRLRGESAGSNSTVPIGAGQIDARVLLGT